VKGKNIEKTNEQVYGTVTVSLLRCHPQQGKDNIVIAK